MIIVSAGAYRSREAGGSRQIDEDRWVPHTVIAARIAVTHAKAAECYVALDVGHWQPVAQRNADLLASVDDCGVLAYSPSRTRAEQLASRVDDWEIWLRRGDVERVASEVSRISGDSRDAGIDLLAQLLMRAGRAKLAFELLQRHGAYAAPESSDDRLLFLVHVAAQANEHRVASELAARIELVTLDVDELETLLGLALLGRFSIDVSELARRLAARYPSSAVLASYRVAELLRTRDYRGLALLASVPDSALTPDEQSYFAQVAARLDQDPPQYDELLDDIATRLPSQLGRARLTCSRDALQRGLAEIAARSAIAIDAQDARAPECFDIAVAALRRLAIQRDPSGRIALDPQLMLQALGFLVSYLATNPAEGSRREQVADLLLPESLGVLGDAALVVFALSRANEPAHEAAPADTGAKSSIEDFEQFVSGALIAMRGEAVMLGMAELPDEISAERAAGHMPHMRQLLEMSCSDLRDEQDVAALMPMLHVAMMLARRAGQPRLRIVWARQVAGELCHRGWPQRARDLAEQILVTARSDPAELRLAWASFADIHHRAGGLEHALLGLTASFTLLTELTLEETWQELYLFLRICRDLHLWEPADTLLARARELLGNVPGDHGPRLETIRLSIAFVRFVHDAESSTDRSARLSQLIHELTANLQQLQELGLELEPVVSLLGQVFATAESLEIPLSPEAIVAIDAARAALGPNRAAMLAALTTPRPCLDDALSTMEVIAETRDAYDLANDLRVPTIVAKRALCRIAELADAEAVDLLELLADHAVRPDERMQPFARSAVIAALQPLLAADYAVHLFALDARGRMAHVVVRGGAVVVKRTEPEAVFDVATFAVWKQQYPFHYACLDRDHVVNEVIPRSMHRLGIGSAADPPEARVALISDAILQQIPGNLLLRDYALLGAQASVAALPSADWYAWHVANPRSITGRRIAWIPVGPSVDDDLAAFSLPPLTVLHERISPVAARHGITVERGEDPPAALAGADLAIVGAHGGLVPGEGYFQVISNDGTRRWSGEHVSYRLRGIGILVLFVCSAGRIETYRRYRTSGFIKRLLASECRAVVASPWPVSVPAAAHWLPTFLDVLASGETVGSAVHEANRHVLDRLGGDAAEGLAMHVFGDPLQR